MKEISAKYINRIYLCIICGAISSLTLMGAMLVNSYSENRALLIILAALFWAGLVFEQTVFWTLNHSIKRLAQKNKEPLTGHIGLLSINASKEGTAAYLVFSLSALGLVLCVAIDLGVNLVQYILICLLVLSFRLHCILNGRVYAYIKKINRKAECKNG